MTFQHLNLALRDGGSFRATNQKTNHQIVAQFGTLQIYRLMLAFIHN